MNPKRMMISNKKRGNVEEEKRESNAGEVKLETTKISQGTREKRTYI